MVFAANILVDCLNVKVLTKNIPKNRDLLRLVLTVNETPVL
jgi:hypothetical protein